jgi:hypothetical protein
VEETSSLTPRPATQQSLSCSNTGVYGAQLGSSSALLLGMQPQSLCAAYTMQTGRTWFTRLNPILTGVSPQHSYQTEAGFSTIGTTIMGVLWTCMLSHNGTCSWLLSELQHEL